MAIPDLAKMVPTNIAKLVLPIRAFQLTVSIIVLGLVSYGPSPTPR